LLAAATNAPIASAIMAIAPFGPAVVRFLIVGHRSVYGSQLLGIVKSGTLEACFLGRRHGVAGTTLCRS
jgi:Asp/Glu/hydantoin racemase